MICDKCGANVPDGYEFCMKCGTKIKTSQVVPVEASLEEAAPEKRKITKKELIPVITVAVVIIALVAIMLGMKGGSEKNGYFANIPWGTDIETVQRMIDKTYKCESLIGKDKNTVIATIENYDGMQGVSALLLLTCEDNSTLNEVSVLFSAEDGSKYTSEKIAAELVKKYNGLFGKADTSSGYSKKWMTKNSTIELLDLTDNLIALRFEK